MIVINGNQILIVKETRNSFKYHKRMAQLYKEKIAGTKERKQTDTDESLNLQIIWHTQILRAIKEERKILYPHYKMSDEEYEIELQQKINGCIT